MENISKNLSTQSKDLLEMHAIVTGKVQGVGFRAATRHYARELGLKGTVRNLADGTVEIYAYGARPQLEELMQRLHQEMQEIKETSIEYLSKEHFYEDFRIIY